jgi:hypothetical protein
MKQDDKEIRLHASVAENKTPDCEDAPDEIISSLGANH